MPTDQLKANPTVLLAQELAQSESPEVIQTLADLATRTGHETVRQAILTALRPMADQRCIDEICATWYRSRHDQLGQLLEQSGWVASKPEHLKLATALKSGQLDMLRQGGAEVVAPLLKACQDADPTIAHNARLVLEQLQQAEAREALFRLIIETDQPLAREVAVAAQYAPQEPQQRALFYVLTEQWEAYEKLDFDQSLIQAVYQASNEWLQSRIAELTRRAGRAEFVQIIAGSRQQRRLADMTEGEWEVVFALLQRRQQWAEMWRLAQAAPAVWGVRLLQQLDDAGWQPEQPADQAGLAELVGLARACAAEGLQLGRLLRCQRTLTAHRGPVNDLAITPDGQLLVSGSDDGTVRLWGLPEGKALKTLEKHSSEVWSVAISPDGRLLVSGSDDGVVYLWRLPDGKFLDTLKSQADALNDLAISPVPLGGYTNQWLLAGGYGNGLIRLWRLPDGKILNTLNGHSAGVVKLAISPDGNLLASGSRDSMIQLWRLPGNAPSRDGAPPIDSEPLQTLRDHTGSVNGLAISPNGRLLASASLDQTVRIWQLLEGDKLNEVKLFKTLKGHGDAVVDLAIQPNGPILASAGLDKTIRLWRLSDGQPLQSLSGHANWVMSLAISPNGRLLSSGGYDNTIKLWSSDLTRLASLPPGQTTLADLEWLQETAQTGKISSVERSWANFMLALGRWRRRFDIEVEAVSPHISIGEFDIELEIAG